MAKGNPLRWELPSGLSLELADLRTKSEEDFDAGTLKGHIGLLMLRALKSVSLKVDAKLISAKEFQRLVENEFESLAETCPPSVTQAVEDNIKVISDESWRTLKEERLRNGIEHHRREYENGRSLGLGILGPKLVPGGEPPVIFRAVALSFDRTMLYRQKMLSLAKEIVTEDFLLNEQSNPILTEMLADVVAGEPLYDFSVAELFELYGELVNHIPEDKKKRQLNIWINSEGFKCKVEPKILGNSFTAKYHSYSRNGYNDVATYVPLPFAVRNTLAHQGKSNPNVTLLNKIPHGVHDSVLILREIKSKYSIKS